MPNFTKTLNLEKPLRGEFYAIEKHNENSDKIDLAIEKITVPTIAHLQNMIELKVGDIVDIQGYYTAGDGAHHKRKIESADDGSGVQLANGLWANIVFNHISSQFQNCKRELIFNSTEGNLQGIQIQDEDTFFISWVTGINLEDRAEQHRITLYNRSQPVHTWNLEPGSHGQQIKIEDKGDYYELRTENRRSEASGWDWNLRGRGYEIWHLPKNSNTGVFVKKIDKFSDSDDLNYNLGFVGEKYGLIISKKIEKSDIRHTVTCTVVKKEVWYDEELVDDRYLSRFTIPSKYTTLSMQTCTVDEKREIIIIGFSETSVNGYPRFIFLDFSGNILHTQYIVPPKQLYGSLTKYEIEGIVEYKGKWFYLIQFQETGMSRHQWELVCCSEFTNYKFGNVYNSKRADYIEDNIIADNTDAVRKRDKAHLRMFESNSFQVKHLAGTENIEIGFSPTDRYYSKIQPSNAKAPSLFFYSEEDPLGFSFQIKDNRVGVGDEDYPTIFEVNKNKMLFKKPTQTETTFETNGTVTHFQDLNGPNRKLNMYFATSTGREYMAIQTMKNTSVTLMFYGEADPSNKGALLIKAPNNGVDLFKISKDGYKFFVPQILSTYEIYSKLDTPRFAYKMQQDGIYEEYLSYIEELHDFDKEQCKLEYQLRLDFENRENKDQSYEDWLSTQPQLMPFAEPQPSQALLDFKKKYLG